eukprot:7435608-Alexandrium_andersonii.AAC.1
MPPSCHARNCASVILANKPRPEGLCRGANQPTRDFLCSAELHVLIDPHPCRSSAAQEQGNGPNDRGLLIE